MKSIFTHLNSKHSNKGKTLDDSDSMKPFIASELQGKFSDLPLDVRMLILFFLPIPDLLNVRKLNSIFKQHVDDENLWKKEALYYFGDQFLQSRIDFKSWKEEFPLYYGVRWSTSQKSSHITLSDGNRVATKDAISNWSSVRATFPMIESVYYEVSVIDEVSVGVSSAEFVDFEKEEIGSAPNTWCYAYNGHYGDGGDWGHPNGEAFVYSGETRVGLMLMKNREGIAFWNDGRRQALVCHQGDLKIKELFITITFYANGSKVSLLPFKKYLYSPK